MNRLLIGVLLALASCGAVASDDIPPPRPVDVGALVNQLGSEDFAEREAATRRLSSLALDPPSELLAAMKSDNPEIRSRAAKVAQAMRQNAVVPRMRRGEQFAQRGRVDLFVAATAAWNLNPEDRRLWVQAFDFGQRLIKKAEMTGSRKPNGCPSAFKDYDEFVDLCRPRYTRVDSVYGRKEAESDLFPSYNKAIQAPGVVDPNGICRNLIVSRGSVAVADAIQNSLVLANGDIATRTLVHKSVLICDGDVTLTEGFITTCVVVARGNITAAGGADTSVLMAGGKVILGKERVTKRQAESGQYNVIIEGEPNTLGLTFFELRETLGLLVKAEGGTVTVTNYKVRGAFRAAGVEIGDVITAVNGKKPDSAESLRRLLRDALAIGDATVVVRRGEKTETLKVSLPE